MKIWPESRTNAVGSPDDTTAYRPVQQQQHQQHQQHLVDDTDEAVDLYIYNSRGSKGRYCWSSWWSGGAPQLWLEEGRPRPLSSVPLATWSLLTTSVKDYQRGVRELRTRILRRIILPAYFFWLVGFLVSMKDLEEGDLVTAGWISSVSWWALVSVICAAPFLAQYWSHQHVSTIFHPAIQTVLDELSPQLMAAGFDVRLVVQQGAWWCYYSTPDESWLRFTSVRDEDREATIAVAAIAANQ